MIQFVSGGTFRLVSVFWFVKICEESGILSTVSWMLAEDRTLGQRQRALSLTAKH